MSDIASVASALDIPEDLASRSANARATANGTSIDDVIAAWAGGGTVASAPAPAPSAPHAEAEAEPTTPDPDEPVTEPTLEPESVGMAPEPAPVAVLVAAPDPEPVEAAPLGDRVGVAGRLGAGIGLVAAVVVVLFASSWLLPRTGAIETDTGFATVVEVISTWVVIGAALTGLAVGLGIAAATRTLTGFAGAGMRLSSSTVVTSTVGLVGGGLVGAMIGAIVAGTGSPSDLDPAIQVVPVLPALLWTLFGWAAGGWAIAGLVQSIGVPHGVDESEFEESGVVRRRLVSAYGIPAFAALSIALVVIPLALIFIRFPGFAPVLAIVVSVGILTFAGLSASRPGMRITTGEFAAAAAGVGVVLLILVSVLLVQGGGHGEEATGDETTGEEAETPSAEGDQIEPEAMLAIWGPV